MKKIIFITGNKNKLREARSILSDYEIISKDIDLPEIQEIDAEKVIREKLLEAYKNHKGSYIVEDTSLYTEALNGLPGPLIKWFIKKLNIDGFADLVLRYENHRARASSMIGYIDFDGKIHFFEGSVSGKIVASRGNNSFGWDPIFEVEDIGKTFAEMTEEEKNKISHRKRAFEDFAEFLNNEKR